MPSLARRSSAVVALVVMTKAPFHHQRPKHYVGAIPYGQVLRSWSVSLRGPTPGDGPVGTRKIAPKINDVRPSPEDRAIARHRVLVLHIYVAARAPCSPSW